MIMRLAVATLGLCTVLIAGLSFSTISTKTEARDKVAGEKTYLIPSSEGYGVAECLTTGAECGKLVAKAWCESKGHKVALAFGLADRADFTGSVPHRTGQVDDTPLVITCN
jgi:hypothetical protein